MTPASSMHFKIRYRIIVLGSLVHSSILNPESSPDASIQIEQRSQRQPGMDGLLKSPLTRLSCVFFFTLTLFEGDKDLQETRQRCNKKGPE